MAEGRTQTFLFADLAGFTALTEAHGDEEAAQLASDFFDCVRELLPEYGAKEIKTIGDAVLLRCEDAAAAVELGLRLVGEIGTRPQSPLLRVGMHTGPAVQRDGDWFGTTVNVAARVSGAAAGGEVLLTEATRIAAGRLAGVEFHERGRQVLRNVAEPVTLYEAQNQATRSAEDLPIDPVCRMAVDPAHGAGQLVHRGVTYHFCSLRCAGAFAASPGRYVGEGANSAPT